MAMTMPELTVVSDADEFAAPQLGRKVLETRALTKSYQEGKVVLDGISFELHAGEFVAVVGRSGAGKSTLLHTLNGTIPATSGEILNVHKDLSTDNVLSMSRKEIREWRTHCGMIFQDFCLVPRLDVISNVLLGRLSIHRRLNRCLKSLVTKIKLKLSNCLNGSTCCLTHCNVQKTYLAGNSSVSRFAVQ